MKDRIYRQLCKGYLHNRERQAEIMTHCNVPNFQQFATHKIEMFRHYLFSCLVYLAGTLPGNTLLVSPCTVPADCNFCLPYPLAVACLLSWLPI